MTSRATAITHIRLHAAVRPLAGLHDRRVHSGLMQHDAQLEAALLVGEWDACAPRPAPLWLGLVEARGVPSDGHDQSVLRAIAPDDGPPNEPKTGVSAKMALWV